MNAIETIKSMTIAGKFDLARRTAVTEANNAAAVAGLPTYSELLAALRRVDENKGHTMHKPAGVKAYSAAVLPREVTDDIAALLAGIPA